MVKKALKKNFSLGYVFLTGRRYGDRRFIKWARLCRDSQLA